MAIAEVHETHQGNGATPYTTQTIGIISSSVGNLIVVTEEWGATLALNGSTISGITDNGGNTYVQVPGAFVDDSTFYRHTDIWYSLATSTSNSITITWGSTTSFGVTQVFEFSGTDTISPLDFGANLDQTAAAPVGPSMTPTVSGELLVAICNSNLTGETNVNAPWTAGSSGDTAYLINAALSPQQAVFTPTTVQGFVSSGAAFLPPYSHGASAKKKSSMFLVF
jgi:hypothetical protein